MIDYANIISLSEKVEIEEETDGMTAFGIWKVAKEVFEQLGLDFVTERGKEIPSQAFYNYSKNGSISGVKGQKRYSDDEVELFVAKLVAKATSKQRN